MSPPVAAPAAQAPAAQAPAAMVILSAPPADGCVVGACEAPCLKKVCIPGTATRTNERRVYGETCEDFCLPKCSLGGGLLGHHKEPCDACPTEGCDGGSCGSCEHHVRTRKYLVVKVKHEEETYTQCTPGYAPAEEKCRAPLFGHKQACAEGACLPPAGCADAPLPSTGAPHARMPSANGDGPAPMPK
jgi:hypothetical protein